MGQVPAEKFISGAPTYLIIGDGKLARHLSFYLSKLGLSHRQWSRRALTSLAAGLKTHPATHALIAVSDAAIEDLAGVCATASPDTRRVHFSGSLTTPLAHGAHPLMSFPETLFEAECYPRIPFVVECLGDRPGPTFAELLPGLPNPHFAIDPKDKALYHALCVMSGNFTVLLWQKFFSTLESRFGIPRENTLEYLRAIALNLESESFPLTGPLARGDEATIARNLAALEGDPYHEVYLSFLHAYRRPVTPARIGLQPETSL